MEALLASAGLAIVVFAATNIDDVFVLLAFLANPRVRLADVVLGQYLGIGTLYLAAVVASLLALVIDEAWLGLLGLVPILLGVMQLRGDDDADADNQPSLARRGRQALAVAGVTLANGGDNIGVYTPLFAVRSGAEIAVFGMVFALLTGLWCAMARWLVSHPRWGAPIRRYARPVVPYVLIALGVLVIWEAGTIDLLRR